MAKKTIGVLGQYGVIKDQPAHELPENAFSDARNVRFKDGKMERMKGQTTAWTPTVTPYFIINFTTATKRYWCYPGLAKVYVHDGTTETNITPASDFTGTASNRWTGGVINGNLVLNNGVENPQFWNGNTATDLATLTGWDTNEKAKALRVFKNYLIALNITKTSTAYPNMVKWSNAALPNAIPQVWDETDVTEDAAETDLSETSDIVVDGLAMGNAFIVYKERSMYAMRETFDSRIFNIQRLPGDIGALAIGCIADTPIGHVVMTPSDVIVHSGQGPVSIADGVIRRYIFESIDATNYKRSFVVHNPAQSEVWVCFPQTGNTNPNIAAVYNYLQKNWTLRELTNVTYAASGQIDQTLSDSWDSDSDSWDDDATTWDNGGYQQSDAVLLITNTTPTVDVADRGAKFAGVAYTSYAERTGLVFDAPWLYKLAKRFTPRIDGTLGATVQIKVGSQANSEVANVWEWTTTYTIGTTYEANGFANGRLLSYRITSLDNLPYSMKSIDIEYETGGSY